MSIIRDQKLAPEGRDKIDWVKQHMPVLKKLELEFLESQPFKGLKIAICIHLEAKTAYMAEVFARSGAEVSITGSNPLSTQDAVCAALVESGVNVFAWYNATEKEYNDHIYHTLSTEPDLIIDDGGDLITMLHQEFPALTDKVTGAAEETTTGLLRLRSMEKEGVLSFPVIAVNDALCKYLFDNRYGTGQSVWDGIMRSTNLLIAGKTVVVAGFGWCGRGVAMRARGLGARVVISEIDPVRALEAIMEGYEVMPLMDAAPMGDIFVTVTGCKGIIQRKHLVQMKDGAILSNAGHFDIEIDKPALQDITLSSRVVRPNIEEFIVGKGKKLFLLAEGRLVNLAAGDGHPAEIMDLSFALQFLAMNYLRENKGKLLPGVIPIPGEIDRKVADLKLEALGVNIDTLEADQKRYLETWKIT